MARFCRGGRGVHPPKTKDGLGVRAPGACGGTPGAAAVTKPAEMETPFACLKKSNSPPGKEKV